MKLGRNRLHITSAMVIFLLLIITGCVYTNYLINFTDNSSDNGSIDPTADIINPSLVPVTNDSQYGPMKYRLVYIRDNIATAKNLEKVESVMVRAKNAGYNGVVFSNHNLEALDSASDNYKKNLDAVKNKADELGLALYPCVLTVGYANAILSHDPNQIEGLPVKDALFVVSHGQANLVSDPDISLPGGNFESAVSNRFVGWDSQEKPGYYTFADSSIKHAGSQSMRIDAKGGVNRIFKTVDVAPYRQYHLSFWMKTQDITNPDAVVPTVKGENGMMLAFQTPAVASTQDWTEYDIVFNSLNNSRVTISLGTWNDVQGKVWFDDASLAEIGLTNVIRRADCPLVVESEDGIVYTEGVDYKSVTDPLLGEVPDPGFYSIYHPSPPIILTSNSRIREGERLRVSFYSAISTDHGMVSVSLTSPEAQAIFRNQIIDVKDALHPSGYFINYDEIRVGNWEASDKPRTQGQLLANSIRSNYNLIRSVSPGTTIFVWNDMFDPYVNAVDNYYLCNGSVDGSYEGLARDMVIVNWNYNDKTYMNSLKFWSGRGNPMILAGYYDGLGLPIGQWLNDASNSGVNVAGAMYTTWDYNYTDLEEFANEAWGGAK
ncbi:conserved hypothetical protein [Methanocella paludicola SANAE]|uniref:CBM-cenC domain-containing protein n=2 Tax=Methanocella TaxID=570266 RepID=D1Z1N3_METPS|nr:conserved hypothetical protein [Methanocella paludicola SANAE]